MRIIDGINIESRIVGTDKAKYTIEFTRNPIRLKENLIFKIGKPVTTPFDETTFDVTTEVNILNIPKNQDITYDEIGATQYIGIKYLIEYTN